MAADKTAWEQRSTIGGKSGRRQEHWRSHLARWHAITKVGVGQQCNNQPTTGAAKADGVAGDKTAWEQWSTVGTIQRSDVSGMKHDSFLLRDVQIPKLNIYSANLLIYRMVRHQLNNTQTHTTVIVLTKGLCKAMVTKSTGQEMLGRGCIRTQCNSFWIGDPTRFGRVSLQWVFLYWGCWLKISTA